MRTNYRSFVTSVSVASMAGTGVAGYRNGTGAKAGFNRPQGVAADLHGNVYVADTGNNRIRKITPKGVVSTFAGDGRYGYRDGPGASARFSYPTGIAVTADGYVYVADQDNHLIRVINPEGFVSTLAGGGGPGYQDGSSGSARFNYPSGVVVDAAGNVYVADQDNHCVRQVTPSGTVSTLAGDGGAGCQEGKSVLASFNFPSAVAVDAEGQVYVTDSYNNLVRMISPSGIVRTLARGHRRACKYGRCLFALFSHPYGIATDVAGNIVVADTYNNRICKVSATGTVITLAGDGQRACEEGCVEAAFCRPTGVALDTAGNIYVADTGNSRIWKLSTTGRVTAG